MAKISKLKQGSYGTSSSTTATSSRALLDHDLVDELRLVVFPVVLGAGERLFGETSDKKALRLVSTQTLGDGLAVLAYEILR
jgi:dihydrofolate reductase